MTAQNLDSEPPSTPRFSVSDFVEVLNQTLDYAFSTVEVEGEVESFKISKNKWVFFNLKDSSATISCFTTVFNLRVPLRDGMKVAVSGTPHLTPAGRFSLTIKNLQPLGEGSIKKAFNLLKEKLTREGLFSPEKKRPLPENLTKIGVISSTTAAGYADFLKILGERWGGLQIEVVNCGVQGLSAVDELIRAFDLFNEQGTVDVIALIRGGGSKDDLAIFNDELLVRKIASSRIPVITGIGHEIDESLADLAADVRASTPSNAAELLTRDKTAELRRLRDNLTSLNRFLTHYLDTLSETLKSSLTSARSETLKKLDLTLADLKNKTALLESLSPEKVLKQGYAILSGNLSPGNVVKITTYEKLITAKVENVKPRSKNEL